MLLGHPARSFRRPRARLTSLYSSARVTPRRRGRSWGFVTRAIGAGGRGASFGSELRRLRLRAGLSQEMLAQRAGLSTASTAAVRAKPTSSSVREHPGIVGHGT